MRKLSLILVWACLFVSAKSFSDSPHGKDLKVPCEACHSSKGWKLDKAIYSFDHNKTALPLAGQHQTIDCKVCHPTLVFSDAKTGCIDCHTDMHNMTVGPECSRCHTPKSWIIENITEMHRRSRLPLTGMHYTADCSGCHPSASLLRFEPNGVECIDCHRKDYNNTTSPNHAQAGYSTNCLECHPVNSMTWGGTSIDHSFFPLTLGHALGDCYKCHTTHTFTNISTVCVSCHQANYNASTNPPHAAINIPTSCADCHTTNPGWKPATFAIHNNYYPLTGAHITTDCNSCHNNNYTNSLPNTCVGCHQANYDKTSNPPHKSINIPTTCADCHTTNPGWKPATFAIHSNYYVLAGAHASLDCSVCHLNNYANTLPTTCVGCHQTNYNQTTNPPHASAQYPTDCQLCHNQTAWSPSTFNHDSQYFPIYSGHHNGTWSTCGDCHTNSSNYQVFSCITCHAHNQTDMDNSHSGVSGYSYNSAACYQCHPTGSAGGKKIKSNNIRQQN